MKKRPRAASGRYCTAAATAILVAASFGCRQPSLPSAEPSPPGEVAVRLADEKDLATAIQAHRGQVVLVDFWATWCEPCTELFPHTVELQREYGGQGLAVITVSLDDTEQEDQDKVLKFLKDNRATSENLHSRFGGSDEAIQRFKIPEAIPHLRLYDRSGKLRRAFPEYKNGKPQPIGQNVTRAIKELLDAGASGP
jgi:thiol-disulfide isomerase/thioredoxin